MPAMDTAHLPDAAPSLCDDEALPVTKRPAPSLTVRLLAERLDCFTVPDLCDLAGVKDTTLEAWRKRGSGPPYVMLGNRPLYPREGLKRFIQDRLRSTSGVDPRKLL